MRILRWLGRENEENVARTRDCCGWPSSPKWCVCVCVYGYGRIQEEIYLTQRYNTQSRNFYFSLLFFLSDIGYPPPSLPSPCSLNLTHLFSTFILQLFSIHPILQFSYPSCSPSFLFSILPVLYPSCSLFFLFSSNPYCSLSFLFSILPVLYSSCFLAILPVLYSSCSLAILHVLYPSCSLDSSCSISFQFSSYPSCFLSFLFSILPVLYPSCSLAILPVLHP